MGTPVKIQHVQLLNTSVVCRISASDAFTALEKVLDAKLGEDMANASPYDKEQTSAVESFNAVIAMFAPKQHSYSYYGMVGR